MFPSHGGTICRFLKFAARCAVNLTELEVIVKETKPGEYFSELN